MRGVFNFDDMVQTAVDNIETMTIDQNYKSEKEQSTDALIERFILKLSIGERTI